MKRLESIRLTIERLSLAMRPPAGRTEAPPAVSGTRQADTPGQAEGQAPSAGASGATARHSVRVDLRYAHLRALVESGVLAAWDIGNAARVQEVVQHMLDRWSSLYGLSVSKGVRIMPGVRNAPNTFQRGQAPLKRGICRPDALKRFDMLPAISTRSM